ncbi:agamous-like MADS-box protein AGL14 [Phoenix dactylifera]|uniref:Agamous-like MADS-box protein AGL14 n=1 Tax=Phoenix dactylifera TaxID=42345 RepID=A0A8B7BQ93_PHODC|nr:agamous-like MADS-box protein AGL14 [Phoenix dactylifera]
MGRPKVQLKFIEEQRKRSATYRKRIGGLKKKASELAILCDIPALAISFGPEGQVETWPEDNQAAGYIIQRYRELSTVIQNKHKLDLPGYMKAEINKRRASCNRRIRDLADTPLLPTDDLLCAMNKSLRELAHQLDSRMEAIKERIQLLKDRQHFNGGETINLGGQCLEIVPRDGMMGIQSTSSGYDLMVSDPYLTLNTSLQYPPQPRSFSFLQFPYVPVSMDEVPLATVPSIPMNMDEVPFTVVPPIPTSSTSPLVGAILENDSANRGVVPVHPLNSSIGLFENHNLMGGGAAEQNHTNIVVAQNNVHHLADCASPKQTSVSSKPWPFAWNP